MPIRGRLASPLLRPEVMRAADAADAVNAGSTEKVMRRLGLLMGLALLTGCATAAPRTQIQPAADISGRWVGTWAGNGIFQIPREELAILEIEQEGNHARGRLMLDGTHAAESVPLTLRLAGATGVRVVADLSGREMIVKHERGARELSASFVMEGDRLVGLFRDTETLVRVVLTREKPATAAPAPPRTSEATPAAPEPVEPPRAAADVAAPPPPLAAAASSEGRAEPRTYSPNPDLKPVYFEFDRAEISSADAPTLETNAEWIKAHGDAFVLIEGHTDERGTDAYNLALGERRAKSAMNYLLSLGVAADRITVVSYGEERPACLDHDEECWRQNRRAIFLSK
jgi:peptidoglycan-associated lipoprotein